MPQEYESSHDRTQRLCKKAMHLIRQARKQNISPDKDTLDTLEHALNKTSRFLDTRLVYTDEVRIIIKMCSVFDSIANMARVQKSKNAQKRLYDIILHDKDGQTKQILKRMGHCPSCNFDIIEWLDKAEHNRTHLLPMPRIPDIHGN